MDVPADGNCIHPGGNWIASDQTTRRSKSGCSSRCFPHFSNEVILACLGETRDRLAVTTSDFVTEYGRLIFRGVLVCQSWNGAFFARADTPESTKRVFVPRDNKVALIESSCGILQIWNINGIASGIWKRPCPSWTAPSSRMAWGMIKLRALRLIRPRSTSFLRAGPRNRSSLLFLRCIWHGLKGRTTGSPILSRRSAASQSTARACLNRCPTDQGKSGKALRGFRSLYPVFEPKSERAPSGRSDSSPRPFVTSSPSLAPQSGRVEANPQPIATSPPPTMSYDPVGAVRAFYLALSRADAEAAQLFVVPAKRGIGPFNQANIKQFYSSLPKPMEILGVELASNDVVKVKYHFVRRNGSECHGDATVTPLSVSAKR